MICPAISSYSFGATTLIFCRMFIHIMEVCMSTGFWWSGGGIICVLQTHFILKKSLLTKQLCPWLSSAWAYLFSSSEIEMRSHRGCDHMIVGFTTICAINAYHHLSCDFESRSWRGVLYATLWYKICQWLATGRWFSPGTMVSTTNKTDRHDITEILLKVVFNTLNQPNNWKMFVYKCYAITMSGLLFNVVLWEEVVQFNL